MKKSNRIIQVGVAAALATLAGAAAASGLAIGTQSGSGTGNAFAGGSALAEDASTVWYNPAGMTQLARGVHFAISAHAIKPSFRFNNTGSTGAFAAAGSGDGGDGGDWTAIPQGYAVPASATTGASVLASTRRTACRPNTIRRGAGASPRRNPASRPLT